MLAQSRGLTLMKADCPGGGGGGFCFCPRICHVHTSHYHLKTIQSLVRVWIMKRELWCINVTSTKVVGRDSPSQDLTPPDNHIPSRFFFLLCFLGEICKKLRKMKYRREWEALHSAIQSQHLVLHLDTRSLRDLISAVFPESSRRIESHTFVHLLPTPLNAGKHMPARRCSPIIFHALIDQESGVMFCLTNQGPIQK